MDTKEYTLSGVRTTLQVAVVKDIPAGSFNLGKPFLIKNVSCARNFMIFPLTLSLDICPLHNRHPES